MVVVVVVVAIDKSPVTRVFDKPGLLVQERGNHSYSLARRLAYIQNDHNEDTQACILIVLSANICI